MVNVKRIRNRSMIVGLLVLILDIILKIIVSGSIAQGQFVKLFGGFITIGKVVNTQMHYGYGPGFYIFRLMLSISFILVVIFFLYRVTRLEVNKLYYYSISFIFFGQIAPYIDRILLSDGNKDYVSMGYFNIAFLGSFLSLSSLMYPAGFLLLIGAVISNFSDFKTIMNFKKPRAEVIARK